MTTPEKVSSSNAPTVAEALVLLAAALRREPGRIHALGRTRLAPEAPFAFSVEITSHEEAVAVCDALTGRHPKGDWRSW